MYEFKSLFLFPSKLEASSLLILTCLASLVLILWKNGHRFSKTKSPSLPWVGKPGTLDLRFTMAEGLRKYPSSPFIVHFQDPTVIIPASSIEAIKNLPDDQMSTNGNIYQRFAGRWTHSGWVDPELQGSIKFDLVRDMNNVYPIIEEEIDLSLKTNLGECSEWTPIKAQATMVSVVAQVTGRVFAGLPLGRDPRWVKASIEHSIAAVMFSHRLRAFPVIMRPLVAPFLAEGRTMQRSNAEITALLTPVINAKMGSVNGAGEKNLAPTAIGPEDARLACWLLGRYKSTLGSRIDPFLIIKDYFTLCFAGIHGPNHLVVQALFDLATYPEYIKPLRDEIDKEAENGRLNAKNVNKLELLDSFCKESARKNPQGLIAWLRKSHKPITLNTGHIIPANMLVAASNPAFTDVFEDGEKFDGYRFIKLRSNPDKAGNCNFSSIGTDSLVFGYGAHSCPGRVFGTLEVKMIVAYILLKFDIQLPGGATERPEGAYHDFMVMLPQTNIEFRARRP